MMKTANMIELCQVKATAKNRDRARTWIEKDSLIDFGFARWEPITVEFGKREIVVRLDPEGKRKVAGRDRDGRKPLQILDLCEPAADRDSRWGGVEKVRVFISHGLIVIKA